LHPVARRLRIEYQGALYHVINRGNYRRDVFETVGAAQAFEKAIAETCERYQWRLHAFAIMRNHFHLALETPEPNLVSGMHWLQGTFATRFNRFRQERGHLFQGRYQALLVENTAALVRVIHYIHLNPVRAKVVDPITCAAFRWSSLRHLCQHFRRPRWLSADALLAELGFSDSAAGWSEYCRYLANLATDATEQANLKFDRLSRGWAIGTLEWKRTMAREYREVALSPGLETVELRELREERWRKTLEVLLFNAGESSASAANASTDAPWKVEIAARLRDSGVPYHWINDALRMGAPHLIRGHVFRFRKRRTP